MTNYLSLSFGIMCLFIPKVGSSDSKANSNKIITKSNHQTKIKKFLVEVKINKYPVESDLIKIGKNIGKLYKLKKYDISFRPKDYSDFNPVFAKISFSSYGNRNYNIQYLEGSLSKRSCGNYPFIWISRLAYCTVLNSQTSYKLIQNYNKKYLKSVKIPDQSLYEKFSHKKINIRIPYLEKAANNLHYEAASLLAEEYRFNEEILNIKKADK